MNLSGQIKLGFVGGYNNITVNDIESATTSIYVLKPNHAFHIGLGLDIHPIKRLSIEPTLLFNQKGFEQGNNLSSEKYTLNYITLQLIGKVHLIEKIKILAGVENSILASAYSSDLNSIQSDIFNNYDLSLLAGIEASVTKKISIHAKYLLGVTSLAEINFTDGSGNFIGKSDYRNRVFMLGISYYPFVLFDN